MAETSIPIGERTVTQEKNFSRTPKVRREAGWRLLEEHFEEIEVLRSDYVRVPSCTYEGRVYTADPTRLFCTCPDNAGQGNVCKHSQAAKWMALIHGSGYRIERVESSRLPFKEWYVFDRETGKPEGVRYSLIEAIADVVELSEFKGCGS